MRYPIDLEKLNNNVENCRSLKTTPEEKILETDSLVRIGTAINPKNRKPKIEIEMMEFLKFLLKYKSKNHPGIIKIF